MTVNSLTTDRRSSSVTLAFSASAMSHATLFVDDHGARTRAMQRGSRRAVAATRCGDDLGEPRPVRLGDRSLAIDQGGGERRIAVDGDPVAAGEAEQLGLAR